VGRPDHPPGWGGAIAGWELTRLARRGSPVASRILVGLLVFAALLVTYLAEFPDQVQLLPPGLVQAELSKFGREFSIALLCVQALVVFLLTPLFVAGAVQEEIERRTLEFLLATDLRPREIVLGKVWPRLLLLVGVVLVGWPVLAATQVWGGVELEFVGLGSLIILGELWAIAGISADCAVGAPTLRKAMIRSYVWSVLLLSLPLCTCPFGAIAALADKETAYGKVREAYAWVEDLDNLAPTPTPVATPPASEVYVGTLAALAGHLLLQFLIGFAGLRRAARKLRNDRTINPRLPRGHRPQKPKKWERHPPVPQESPLLWKEIHLSGQTSRFVRSLSLVPSVVWLCVSSVFTLVGFAILGESNDVLSGMNGMIRWVGGLMVALMAVMVGLHAAGSVARERQQETLTDLLTIPRPRREIIAAKWVGSLAKAKGIAIGTAAVPLVGVIAEGLSFWAVVPLVLAAFAFLACAASFGLWLSVRARTVQRATGMWLLIVGLWVGGTFLAAEAAYMDERTAARRAWLSRSPLSVPEVPILVWDRALNPLLAWSALTFRIAETDQDGYSWRDEERPDGVVHDFDDVWPSLLGVGLYSLLAWVLYRLASRRFEREGRG
jgi:ABC-type transport system involved in multi-copper enzyme maturation permease subunit